MLNYNFYQEVTEWDIPNHTYLLNNNKDKMIGYVPRSTGKLELFKVTMPFSTTRRKFKQVENTFGYKEKVEAEVGRNWVVKGSKGDTYKVSLKDGHYICTCSGYKFRGACKHSTKIEEQNGKK